MKKTLLAAALAASPPPPRSQTRVRSSSARWRPKGSTWHELLKEMAEKWEQASNGQVKLRIYAGGTQGNEGEMVRKMAVGQLQGAAVTTVGLHDIAAEPQALTVPLMFETAAAAEGAFDTSAQVDAAREEGLRGAHWGRIGAIKLFCTRPSRRRPTRPRQDLRVGGRPGERQGLEGRRASTRSCSPPPTSTPRCRPGMIECIPNVPLYVLTARLFEKAPYMIDVSWSY